MKWLGYCGLLGFLGFLYFIEGRTSLLSGFLFFSFFRFYYLDKINRLSLDENLLRKMDEFSKKFYAIPLVVLIVFSNAYIMQIQIIIIISIFTVVITFISSSMIPYYYIKNHMRKDVLNDKKSNEI